MKRDPNYVFLGMNLRISEKNTHLMETKLKCGTLRLYKQYLRKGTQEIKLTEFYFCYKLSQSQLI